MTPQTKLKAVETVFKSRGWAVIHEIMEDDIVAAAMVIADNPQMSIDEINYRRGAIWAAKRLLSLPERLKQHLMADIALAHKDDNQSSPIE